MGLREDKGQQREGGPGLHVLWLTLPAHTTWVHIHVCVCVCVNSWECVRSLGSWQVSVDMHGHILFASECARSSAESPLSRLFSPLCHHDNLLTPAQLHTANISLPSPVTCSSSAPHPPHLLSSSHPSLLYSPAFISSLQCLQLHL